MRRMIVCFRQAVPLWWHESPPKALQADLGAQFRDREHPCIRLGLPRSPSGRAQHLRGRGHKGRVVGHGRLQANSLRDGLLAVFFGFTTGEYLASPSWRQSGVNLVDDRCQFVHAFGQILQPRLINLDLRIEAVGGL